MAREIRAFEVVIPAGTAKSANFKADISFPDRTVEEIEIRIPPGPRGEMGFALGAAGRPIIPEQAGLFMVTDDEVIRWPLEGYHDSGSWTLFGYNTGTYDHTVRIRFLLNLVQLTAQAQATAGGPLTIGPGSIGPGGVPPPGGPPPPAPPLPAPPPPSPPPPAPPPPAPPPPVPPPPPIPPPPPSPPLPGGPPTIKRDVMPAEVPFPPALVVSVPYDVVLSYNPAFARGYVTVRNPGQSQVSGRLVYVSDTSGVPITSFDYNLGPGQGTTWHLDSQTQVGDVVLQSSSGPVTVSWKVGTL